MQNNPEHNEWLMQLIRDGEVYLGAANVTAFYDKADGSVEVNNQGLERYYYSNLQDFVVHSLDGLDAPHMISYYIGDRDDEGKITYTDNYPTIFGNADVVIDDDEDGSSVYTAFVPWVDPSVHNGHLIPIAQFAILRNRMVVMGQQCNNRNVCFECIIEEHGGITTDESYDHAYALLEKYFPDYA